MTKSSAKTRGNKIELKVGLFIVVPIVIIIIITLLKLGYFLMSSTIDVNLKIDNLRIIKKGTPVQIKGYQIGRVVRIKPVFQPSLHFIAKLRVRKDVLIYKNCKAYVMSQNVIGEPLVEIQNPPKKERKRLIRDGEYIDAIQSGSLEEIMLKANTLLTDLNAIIAVYRDVTVEGKQDIKSLVSGVAGTVNSINLILRNTKKDIIETMALLKSTAQTMNSISEEVEKNPIKFLFRGKKKKKKKRR